MPRSIAFRIGGWFLFVAFCVGATPAQQPAVLHILLLNGNDGKPLTIGNTGQPGAPLSLTIFANCGHVCFFPDKRFTWAVDNAGRTKVPLIADLKSLMLMKPTSWLAYCQGTPDKYGALPKDPEFPVDEILRSGVVAPNTCNDHLHLQPQPGQLIFFLRPLSWWEKLTKPPQM